MNKLHDFHRIYFIIIIFATLLFNYYYSEFFVQNEKILFIFLILLIGYPHGSFDYNLGKIILSKLYYGYWFIIFLMGYLSITILFIILWFYNPGFLIIFFLAISIYHFGTEDYLTLNEKKNKFINIIFRGSIPIVTPYLFYFDSVNNYFKILSNNNNYLNNQTLFFLIKIFLIIIIVFYILKLIISMFKNIKYLIENIEPLIIILLFANLSPLIAFTFYFCFLHSIRHVIDSLAEKENKIYEISKILLISMIVVIPISIILMNYSYNLKLDGLTLKIIFIGLFSLTIPHLILNIYYNKIK